VPGYRVSVARKRRPAKPRFVSIAIIRCSLMKEEKIIIIIKKEEPKK
jgi:hypothetical protein